MRPFLHSDVEVYHLAPIVGLVAHLLLHLRLVLLVVRECQHLRVLLLQALHVHQVALDVAPQRFLLLLDSSSSALVRLRFELPFNQHGGATVLH